MNTQIHRVIKIFGNQSALARALGISSNAVSKWVAQGYIPPARALEVYYLAFKQNSEISLEMMLRESAQLKT